MDIAATILSAPMRLFTVHQNFPGQFRHLARHYAALSGCAVTGLGEQRNLLQRVRLPGVNLLGYECPVVAGEDPLQRALRRGRIVAAGAAELRRSGYRPDVILAHIGWGEALFLKDVFPEAKLLLYCEYFYREQGGDFGFDAEFPVTEQQRLDLRVMNAPLLMALDAADAGIAPTQWQRSRFPDAHAARISVIHDGIDTEAAAPAAGARFRNLTAADEVVTYVARNLEPCRGFHVFMRSLPGILRRRPKAQVVIVGGDGTSYAPPLPGDTWRQRMLRELQGQIDTTRVHFTGQLPYTEYLALLRISSAHVYLTYPFVLSWSLLEAMACGCLVVASRTAPVEEVVRDRKNGLLVDFFSTDEIAERVAEALEQRAEMQPIRQRARRTVVERYDLGVSLPAQTSLLAQLAR